MNETDPTPYLLPFASAEATLDHVGGKGASLARLAAAGLPVPDGFYVTTAAYKAFVAENQLTNTILSAAATARADQPATLDAASNVIRAAFDAAVMPAAVVDAIQGAYVSLGVDRPAVAVRSSATAEDLPTLSFAGQQETYLNVQGADAVVDAVKRCWGSLWTARAIGYRAREGILPEDVSLAVVVQRLVAADVSGILFTANPLTGARDRTMINAAWGLGEAVVGSLVTPDTLVLDTVTGAVVEEAVADKAVMTVRTAKGTEEVAVPEERRKVAALSHAQAAELAGLGARIEALFGGPMDIEWAIAGGQASILQARPITALPEPPIVLDWTPPREGGRYARGSVIELLPDPLTPLFRTLALPAWSRAMKNLMKMGNFGDALPDPSLVTVQDYAYYDYGMTPWQSLKMLWGFLGGASVYKRMLGNAATRWSDEARPRYAALIASIPDDLEALSSTALLDAARAIVEEAAAHYLTIQSGILPVAYMSEAAFTGTYERLAKRDGDPPALTFMLGFESEPIRAEESLWDLALWARSQPALAEYLGRTPSPAIVEALRAEAAFSGDTAIGGVTPSSPDSPTAPVASSSPDSPTAPVASSSPDSPTAPVASSSPDSPTAPVASSSPDSPTAPVASSSPDPLTTPATSPNPDALTTPAPSPIPDAALFRTFAERFKAHLDHYGHAIYDLDFAKHLPADDPAPLIEALKHYVAGEGRDPHARQAAAAAARKQATDDLLGRMKGPRGRWFRWILPMAQRYAPLREDGLADVGLGWPEVRRLFGTFGKRLVAAGVVDSAEDVYWLTVEELADLAARMDAATPELAGSIAPALQLRDQVIERRAAWARELRVTPPVVLPERTGAKFMGFDFSKYLPAHMGEQAGDVLKGIGASPGRVSAAACVLNGPAAFHLMRHGDVLVAKITTPAWTPLFALAAGVVTDVGGPLSHSSIVAREYGIPAVLGTGVATQRIAMGQALVVDGSKGEVALGPLAGT